MKNFKPGDRVYYVLNNWVYHIKLTKRHKQIITHWQGDIISGENPGPNTWYPEALLVPENIYNSKLYKLLNDET